MIKYLNAHPNERRKIEALKEVFCTKFIFGTIQYNIKQCIAGFRRVHIISGKSGSKV